MWGVMMALYGSRWTSQFGEAVDVTGQWAQTLNGVTRRQMADTLQAIRVSGRAWPPTAPELRAMCLSDSSGMLSVEAAYAQALEYQRQEITADQLNPLVYHTITKNLDSYQFKRLALDKAMEAFRFAYRATVEQVAAGQSIVRYQPPAGHIENQGQKVTPQEAQAARQKLMDMVNDMRKPEPVKTPLELADEERLERIKNE